MGNLYNEDFHAWTRQQADALRRVGSLPGSNELDLDWLPPEAGAATKA